MPTNAQKYLKFFIGILFCLFVRMIPFRAPNVEPIMTALMPMGKAHGGVFGFMFGALSIFLYDLITGTLGVRTIFTAGAYGVIGFWAAVYFKNQKNTRGSYVKFAIFGTLFFDTITGLIAGPVLFDQPFLQALSGQIPFTILHLAGNVAFAYVLSPGIYNFLIRKKESASKIIILNPKTI